MKAEKKPTTTYTYELTDMTEREVRVLLYAMQHEIREVNKVLRVAGRPSASSTNDLRKKRLSDKWEEYEAMRKALFTVLGLDEDDDDEEPDED